MVTLLTPDPEELLPLVEPLLVDPLDPVLLAPELLVVLVGVLEVVVVGVLDVVVVVGVLDVAVRELEVSATVVFRAASAGSWPEASTTAISSQLATNRASAPEMTRRRSIRVRRARFKAAGLWAGAAGV